MNENIAKLELHSFHYHLDLQSDAPSLANSMLTQMVLRAGSQLSRLDDWVLPIEVYQSPDYYIAECDNVS